ncbi:MULTISPECIES: MFS transporter [Streptomyces]|uniref:MFS transporter n=1 Tax=Streptomyces ramulosus TaxID=47762 RepID=A0ABW1FHJ0_9ACTN
MGRTSWYRDRAAGRACVAISISVLTAIWLLDYVDRQIIPVVLPSVGRDLSLSTSQLGLSLTIYYAAYALFQIPAGLLADRFGSVRLMVWGVAGWSVFTAVTGLVANGTQLALARVLFAASVAVLPAASTKALVERVPAERRVTANSLLFTTTTGTSALAPVIGAALVTHFGWRGAFFGASTLGVLGILLLWLLPPALGQRERSRRLPRPSQPLLPLLRRGVLWRFALLVGGFNIVGYGIVTWLPSYLIKERQLSLGATGLASALPIAAEALTMAVGGILYDRYFATRSRRLIVPALLANGAFLILMLFASSTATFLTFLVLAMAAQGIGVMPLYGLPLRYLPPDIAGTANGLINFGAQSSAAVSPYAMGLLAEHAGFLPAFALLLGGVVLSVAAAFWIPQEPAAFCAGVLGRAPDPAAAGRGADADGISTGGPVR